MLDMVKSGAQRLDNSLFTQIPIAEEEWILKQTKLNYKAQNQDNYHGVILTTEKKKNRYKLVLIFIILIYRLGEDWKIVKAAMGRKGTLKTCSMFRCILLVAFEEGCVIIIKRPHQHQSAWVFEILSTTWCQRPRQDQVQRGRNHVQYKWSATPQ